MVVVESGVRTGFFLVGTVGETTCPIGAGQIFTTFLMLMKILGGVTIFHMVEHFQKTIRAKQLRKNMSDAERNFWYRINNNKLGVKFRRQYPIGPYFADFACLEKRLIIELDGEQHARNIEYDNKRTEYIESIGYTVIRIANSYLSNKYIDDVIEILYRCISEDLDYKEYFVSRWG